MEGGRTVRDTIRRYMDDFPSSVTLAALEIDYRRRSKDERRRRFERRRGDGRRRKIICVGKWIGYEEFDAHVRLPREALGSVAMRFAVWQQARRDGAPNRTGRNRERMRG